MTSLVPLHWYNFKHTSRGTQQDPCQIQLVLCPSRTPMYHTSLNLRCLTTNPSECPREKPSWTYPFCKIWLDLRSWVWAYPIFSMPTCSFGSFWISHMEILSPSTSDQFWGKWSAVTQVPKLTHINMEDTIRVNDVLKPRLKLLIVVVLNSDSDRQDLAALYKVEDNRLELLERYEYVDFAIPRSFDHWEINLNEEEKHSFSEVRLYDHWSRPKTIQSANL